MSYSYSKLTTDLQQSVELHPDHPQEDVQAIRSTNFGNEAHVLYNDSKPFFIGGFLDHGGGVASFFGGYTVHFRPIHAREVKKRFDMYFRTMPYHRVQHFIKPSNIAGQRLAQFMGTQYEGTLRKYDGENDYDLYARVKNGS